MTAGPLVLAVDSGGSGLRAVLAVDGRPRSAAPPPGPPGRPPAAGRGPRPHPAPPQPQARPP
ncbi:hypothetical protein ACFV0R_30580, partial [Streptomyces sp. NPDC059578]